MQRQIDLLDKEYSVTVSGQCGEQSLRIDAGESQTAALTVNGKYHHMIQLGDQSADLQMAVKGETAYIQAFGRTFTLSVIDPVEQAAQATGTKSDATRAPMPGMLVEKQVAAGENVVKGQPMVTIESMKILTVITAPRDGEVSIIHFEPGDAFDKNALLVTLREEEEA